MTTPENEQTDRSARRGNHIVLLTGAFIFLGGALAGSGLTFLVFENMVSQRFRHPERMVSSIIDDMQARLSLTPEQRKQVESILEQKRLERDRMFEEEFRPKMDAHFEALKADIASVLTEAQAEKWTKEFDEMRRRFGPPSSPPPGAR